MSPGVGKLPKFMGWEPLIVVQWKGSLGETWEPGFLLASFLVVPLMLVPSQELTYQLVKSLQNRFMSRAANGDEGNGGDDDLHLISFKCLVFLCTECSANLLDLGVSKRI